MKTNSLLFALIAFSLFSCDPQDETSPSEDTRLYAPYIWATRTADALKITVRVLPGDALGRPYTIVEPDELELYQSIGDLNDFKKIADVENDETYLFELDGLTTGTPYYYYLKSKKDGLETTTSNTIMVVPTVVENPVRITNAVGFPIESASISPSQDRLAYVNTAYTWDNGMYGAPSLFFYDLSTHESSLIQRQAVFPDWSPQGDKLVFCTDQDEAATEGYRPQQLAMLDIASGLITKLTTGQVFNLNPAFSPDGNWIAYASDEAAKNVFDIWKMRPDGTDKARLTTGLEQVAAAGNIGVGRPTWSPDGESIYYGVLSEMAEKDGIFRLDLTSNSTEAVVQSQWDEIAPSISPDGKKMAFISDRSGLIGLWLYDLETEVFTQLTGVKNGFVEYNWGKIEWLDNSTLLLNAYTDDGTGNNAVYRMAIE